DQRGLIRLARGFDSRSRDSRLVHSHAHADVAQLGEARRSDRRQCRFESDRQYDTWTWRNGSAPASGAGGWRFDSSRPDPACVANAVDARWWKGYHAWL